MTFDQLDCFIAVAKFDTFFEAAETLHMTQSTLSKQIMKLEKELGITLLDRSKRSAELTDAGRMFFEEAQALSAQYHQMLLHVRHFSENSARELRIGVLPIMSQYHLTGPVREFTNYFPQIRLTIVEAEERELMEGLTQERFDLVIAREHMTDLKKQIFVPLAADSLVAVLPVTHTLAKRKRLTIQELANEKFILMHNYTSIYQVCMDLFQEAGITPEILRTARMESILSAVEVGEGISLFAEGNYHLFRNEGVTAVPLVNSPALTIGMIRRRDGRQNPSCAAFIKYMKNHSDME